MKKVLLISFFSTSRTGGSFRPAPLAKYLPEFGWEPIILTPFLTEKLDMPLRIIETPYHDVLDFWRKLFRIKVSENVRKQAKKQFGIISPQPLIDFALTVFRIFFSYPDLYRGWKQYGIRAGEELLHNEPVDAMISCTPITSHLIAKELKNRHPIPWVADFPDLWSQLHGYPHGPLRKLVDTRLERKTLASASALVTISQPWAEKLRTLHKDKTVHMITHGFDPATVNTPPVKLTSKFTITYTGLIYHKWQDSAKLFAALEGLISQGLMNPAETEVRFYGNPDELLQKKIEQFDLADIVKQYCRVPQQLALQKQHESQLLLLQDWDDPRERGVYTSKIFEYLGARRPILATGGIGGNVVDTLLRETKTGIHAPTVEGIKEALLRFYAEYKATGGVSYNGNEVEVNKYSHREMAKKFAKVLDKLTQK